MTDTRLPDSPSIDAAPDPMEPARPNEVGGGGSATRSVLAVVLPPLIMGVLILGLWYFISYGMLDERR